MVSWLAHLSSLSICISCFTLSTVSRSSSKTPFWVSSRFYLSSSVWLSILLETSVHMPCSSVDLLPRFSDTTWSYAWRAGKSFERVSSKISTSWNLVLLSRWMSYLKVFCLSSMNICSWCSWFFLSASSASKPSLVSSVIRCISCCLTKWISDWKALSSWIFSIMELTWSCTSWNLRLKMSWASVTRSFIWLIYESSWSIGFNCMARFESKCAFSVLYLS